MKITGITVNNFVGLPHFKHEPTEAVLFVAGGNGAGKTSLIESIRFALTGEAPRGAKKASDRPELITEGANTGFVQIDIGGDSLRRAIASGKLSKESPELPPNIELCLDASRFAQLPEGDRRKLLFGLSGVKVDRDTVSEQLALAEIPPHVIAEVLPKLANGFPTAASYARDQAASARGAWKAIAGETYGSVKAQTWEATAEGEAPTDVEIDEESQAIARYEQRIVELAQAAGRASSAVSDEHRDNLHDLADGIGRAQKELDSAQAVYDGISADVTRLEGEARGHTGHTVHCPACNESLRITGSGLEIAEEGASETPVKAKAALAEAKAKAHDAYGDLQKCHRAVAHHAAAATTLSNLPPPPNDEDYQAGELLEEERRRAQLHRDVLQMLLRRRRDHAEAESLTERAREQHELVAAWAGAEKELGPDGIPATILSRALDPINDALAGLVRNSGWLPAAIARDLGLTYGGRAYHLVSESEQWRADAMFAAVIAERSGSNILLLDRFDVLEPSARGDAIDWLCDLTEAGIADCVIVAGTLKAKPDMGEGVDVVWLEGKSS